MAAAWRISRTKYASTAFTGEGAAKTGGRWNSRGNMAVYASGSLSLAALEVLVHFVGIPQLDYVYFKIEFDDKLITQLQPEDLPTDWNLQPPGPGTQVLGDQWIKGGKSAVLAVPSVIIPGETNYLLNPLHHDFRKIRISQAMPFSFDPRLVSPPGVVNF